MFRFWGSESRGSDTAVQVDQPMFDLTRSTSQPFVSEAITVTTSPRPPKRRRPSNAAILSSNGVAASPTLKRQKLEDVAVLSKKDVALVGAEGVEVTQSSTPKMAARLERAKEKIEAEFSQEILLKHQEHRLASQELAKCQIALEQLRRCHLIPYPINVPTYEQMLNITNGQGPALQTRMGAQVPQWAPPFGVTDGPYARHLAKWLIPDPKFDGIPAPILVQPDSIRARSSVDARSARRSTSSEVGNTFSKSRRSRESIGQKLQALPSGYTQPKGKAGPCTLKRVADGKMVKLVCVTCHREDFSSTQGFINHCRIAHKQEYKSHEEAAVACGHIIDSDDTGVMVGAPAPVVVPAATPSGPAHPFARTNATMGHADACFSVVKRIDAIMDAIRDTIPSTSSAATVTPSADFKSSAATPNLSALAMKLGKDVDMDELVRDAKTRVDLDVLLSPEDDTDDSEDETPDVKTAQSDLTSAAVGGMRIPVRKPVSPVPPPVLPGGIRPSSSSGRVPPLSYATPIATPALHLSDPESESPGEDDMDIDLSPTTAVSNKPPSLVSDDDDYDDSVDGSCDESDVDDNIDTESMTDVAEIHFDDEGPSAIRHHRGSASGPSDAMRLRKEEEKHVTFMSPVRESPAPATPLHGGLKRKNRI